MIQDAESYQVLPEDKEHLETLESVRRGLELMKAGRGKTLDDFLVEFSREYGFDTLQQTVKD